MQSTDNPQNSSLQSHFPSRIHVIGICGVATSALAIAFHRKGAKVTGSDKGFFPPVSTELEKHGVPFYAGWHPEKMIQQGIPEAVIVGTASGSQNPETAYAKEHGIPMYSFAEAIGAFFAKEKSIVCSGTWGKTSSSALLSHIMTETGYDPTYMFGGVSLSHESSAKLTDSTWSVFEGDEYKSSPTDPTAKFFYYKPTHLYLTAVSWDHADLYPTEESYFEAFNKLLGQIPSDGFVVCCADQQGIKKVIGSFKGKIIGYGRAGNPNKAEYEYGPVTQTINGLSFEIIHNGKKYPVKSPLLGLYQAENITGCFAIAHSLGINEQTIVNAIATFKGMKRRLEKRLEGPVTIFDDIAHSPEKAMTVLSTLKSIYTGKVYAIFEPNTGGRRREASLKYDDAFKDADEVIIPRLTKLKVAEEEMESPIEGEELAKIISKTQPQTVYIEEDGKLVEYLKNKAKPGDAIVFLGSHGFRNMIEESVSTFLRLQSQS